ncbi:MAG: response regulator transcription factor [Pseudomonadota bacterium]
MIRVLVADDQTLVRQGIKALLDLSPDIRVVAEAVNGDDALRQIIPVAPDVLLLDVRMPGRNGLDVLRVLGEPPHVMPPTILLTTFDDEEVVYEGLSLGARAFLLKDVSLERLEAAIRAAADDKNFLYAVLNEDTTQRLKRKDVMDFDLQSDELTGREFDVLRLMSAGFNNREIADMLTLAEGTVKNYVSKLLAKLGVRDRTRAVLKAAKQGLL